MWRKLKAFLAGKDPPIREDRFTWQPGDLRIERAPHKPPIPLKDQVPEERKNPPEVF